MCLFLVDKISFFLTLQHEGEHNNDNYEFLGELSIFIINSALYTKCFIVADVSFCETVPFTIFIDFSSLCWRF